MDNEVFWELLAQLLQGEQYRPPDVIFSPSVLAEVFGTVHHRLSALPVGGSVALADLAELRQDLPPVIGEGGPQDRPCRFRYVEVRRGAVFEGMPTSRTARLFRDMTEETMPWMLILVPEPSEG